MAAKTSKSPAKKTPPPRPDKNSDGQDAQPAPQDMPQIPGQAPSLVPPGAAPPMAQIAAQHAAMTQPPMPAAGPPQGAAPGGAGPAPGGGMPPGQAAPVPGAAQGINPSQWQHNQVREGINFKDLPPMAQAQAQEQEGINPAVPLQMIQGQLQSSMTEPGGPQGPPQGTSPVPGSFIGPMVPPGVENFPHDMAALTQVMQRGYAPGADSAEHGMAQNAHSMARAAEAQAQNQASQANQHDQVLHALGGLMQHLSMNGALPAPEDVARKVARGTIPGLKGPTGQPQLQSNM